MRNRTHSREIALQILYTAELNPQPIEEILSSYWENNLETTPDVRGFAEKLVRGVLERAGELDAVITKAADNWVLERMAVIDKNILRLGAYELLFCSDVPPKVAINEAVNIAKKFSQEESGKFVNGVLDKINHTTPRQTCDGARLKPGTFGTSKSADSPAANEKKSRKKK